MPATLSDLDYLAPVIGLHCGYIYAARTDGFDIHSAAGGVVHVDNSVESSLSESVRRAKEWLDKSIKSNELGQCWIG